jgi:histidinol-phosphate aminotransferase
VPTSPPFNAGDLALPHLRALSAYTPGTQPVGPGWIKLNTNECPYPPSPRVAEAIRREVGVDGTSLRLYPNPSSRPLREALAAHHGVGTGNVCVGNGSDDILNLLVRLFCSGATAAGLTLPSYSLYPVLVGIQDGRCDVVEFDRTMRLPVERIVSSSSKAFFLTSPNAPTGVGFGTAEIGRVLQGFPGILVVDEAYAPFAAEDAVPLLAGHPNLVVVRTFSKAYALAGIRVGYALAQPDVVGLLDLVRDSYNVSRVSQVAALAALGDTEYYREVIGKVRATRDAFVGRCAGVRGWFTYPSAANFVFTEPRDGKGRTGAGVAAAAFSFLEARKILVRRFPSHALTESFLRITVGTNEEMLALDQALEAWANSQ